MAFKSNGGKASSFNIHLNNMMVKGKVKNIRPEKILILLPRCMQVSSCTNVVMENINNCTGCGKCTISSIVDIGNEFGVLVRVAGGGTAARDIVKQTRPGLIIAIACERELLSGIKDVDIPTLGIMNEMPNGPCNHTTVDVDILKQRLNSIIIEKLMV